MVATLCCLTLIYQENMQHMSFNNGLSDWCNPPLPVKFTTYYPACELIWGRGDNVILLYNYAEGVPLWLLPLCNNESMVSFVSKRYTGG